MFKNVTSSPNRYWSCYGTSLTGKTVPRTPWTTPSMPTSRSLTTPVHKWVQIVWHVLYCLCGLCDMGHVTVLATPLPLPSQERESQKLHWLQRCVEELDNEKWFIPALKQMKEICMLYLEVRHHMWIGLILRCSWTENEPRLVSVPFFTATT